MVVATNLVSGNQVPVDVVQLRVPLSHVLPVDSEIKQGIPTEQERSEWPGNTKG
jgi:hypothetical protein